MGGRKWKGIGKKNGKPSVNESGRLLPVISNSKPRLLPCVARCGSARDECPQSKRKKTAQPDYGFLAGSRNVSRLPKTTVATIVTNRIRTTNPQVETAGMMADWSTS